jgi:pteridine reductase
VSAALVTGGAKRLGRDIALYLADNGFDIALHYNHSHADAEAVKREVEAKGRRCVLFQANLADVDAIAPLMAAAKNAFPKLNVLINSASVFERVAFMETDEAVFNQHMEVNLKAPFFLTQAFAKQVGKGSVVNLLDTHITTQGGSHFAYLLSKKAFAEFTQMAARALAPDVRVNGICLGVVLPSGEHDEIYMKKLATTLPMRTNATPTQVAEVVLHLLNMPVTGQLLFVDGGEHLL